MASTGSEQIKLKWEIYLIYSDSARELGRPVVKRWIYFSRAERDWLQLRKLYTDMERANDSWDWTFP